MHGRPPQTAETLVRWEAGEPCHAYTALFRRPVQRRVSCRAVETMRAANRRVSKSLFCTQKILSMSFSCIK